MAGIDAGLRAMAHPGRRRVLELIWDRERPSSELAERCHLSKPAMSQHLAVLRQAGLVTVRADGNRRLYRVRAQRLAEIRDTLDRFWADRLDALRDATEARAAQAGWKKGR